MLLPADTGSPPYEDGSQQARSAVVSVLGRRWPHGIVLVENSGLAQDTRVAGNPALARSHVVALRNRGNYW